MTSDVGESHFLALGLGAGDWELWGQILAIAAEFGSPEMGFTEGGERQHNI